MGTFMMNSLNAKKKEKKRKGRKNKSFMHAFMHPHHIIPFIFIIKTYFEKFEKENKGPQGQVFTWDHSTYFLKGIHVMLIFRFSFGCRHSPRDWSNLFQKEVIFAKSICFWIEALYMVMVVESFGCRPSPRDWSNLFFKKKSYLQKVYCFWIGSLYMVMVVESFRCRPSPRDWSNLFKKKLYWQKYMFWYRGPLRSNGCRVL